MQLAGSPLTPALSPAYGGEGAGDSFDSQDHFSRSAVVGPIDHFLVRPAPDGVVVRHARHGDGIAPILIRQRWWICIPGILLGHHADLRVDRIVPLDFL